ncbi:hypothetical protein X943_003560 [Babesia divergens]|uniref:HTH OST-type domain-containing protein n=1 Tax=Babesia divergens TaxID=32595 RepID=A0AAD9LJA2_BABDI|nr:hypothetical protein X943_003560 [Babesia divergens]
MARVLHSQWSTSTVDWDDFCTSLGSTRRPKRTKYYTSGRWLPRDGDYNDTPGVPSSKNTLVMVDLALNDIYDIICELYEEEIVPTLHEIRRKLQRNHASLVDAKWLIKICSNDTYQRFHVVNLEEGQESQNDSDLQRHWAIMLAGKPLQYRETLEIDPHDLVHVFQCAVKLASAIMVDSLKEKEELLHMHEGPNPTRIGGRYLFAEYLRKAGPKHFRKQPIGRLVRLVQASLDANILVYQDNNIVPAVSSSTTARKLLLRLERTRSTSATGRQLYTQHLRNNIITLLKDRPTKVATSSPERKRRGPRVGLVLILKATGESISLCKLPSVYKQKFNEELDYAAGGYPKLADFIREELPECSVESYDGEKRPEYTSQYTPQIGGTIEGYAYVPSTTLLFPLGLSASRFDEKAVKSLLTEW